IVGIMYYIYDTSPPTTVIKSLGASGHNWEVKTSISEYCGYKGNGFWASGLIFPGFEYSNYFNVYDVLLTDRGYNRLDIRPDKKSEGSANVVPSFLSGSGSASYDVNYSYALVNYPDGSPRGSESSGDAILQKNESGQIA
ncbi:hypothetical protein, partial [Francisella tularensis]|uniref:hypothetical protein n=1 Tax=Francisella tularensis TaxID=263 RepID=UPI001F166011